MRWGGWRRLGLSEQDRAEVDAYSAGGVVRGFDVVRN